MSRQRCERTGREVRIASGEACEAVFAGGGRHNCTGISLKRRGSEVFYQLSVEATEQIPQVNLPYSVHGIYSNSFLYLLIEE